MEMDIHSVCPINKRLAAILKTVNTYKLITKFRVAVIQLRFIFTFSLLPNQAKPNQTNSNPNVCSSNCASFGFFICIFVSKIPNFSLFHVSKQFITLIPTELWVAAERPFWFAHIVISKTAKTVSHFRYEKKEIFCA